MMGEVSDLLAARGVRHERRVRERPRSRRAIDLAAMAYRNLNAAVRFVMAGAIESRAELTQLRDATAATALVVCRLTAPVGVMQERVRAREPGMWQQKYVDRVAVLEARLDAAAVEHFSLPNDGARSITCWAKKS
jgi:hypothetical protein